MILKLTNVILFKYKAKSNIDSIAMINSGGIRSALSNGNITTADLLEIFPFENSIDTMELKGITIRQILEKSAGLLTTEQNEDPPGGFIQVSGILNW